MRSSKIGNLEAYMYRVRWFLNQRIDLIGHLLALLDTLLGHLLKFNLISFIFNIYFIVRSMSGPSYEESIKNFNLKEILSEKNRLAEEKRIRTDRLQELAYQNYEIFIRTGNALDNADSEVFSFSFVICLFVHLLNWGSS